MVIEGVSVTASGLANFTLEEGKNYVDYVRARVEDPASLAEIKVIPTEDGKVDVKYTLRGEKFERIRRITGYLVGTTDRWNDAKRAEESERVKHL